MGVALVTGAGGGIGRAIAMTVARQGASLAVLDIDAARGRETAGLIESEGGQAVFFEVDMAEADMVRDCVLDVERRLGPIDAFANNAGVEGVVAPIHQYPDDVFEHLLQVNAKGVFLGLKYVLARMVPRGRGAVVNTASTSSIRGRAGLAGYVASKHAVLGLTRVAALDVADSGVRVNAVLPGPVETRMIQSLDQQAKAAGGIQRAGGQAHYADPRQVADVVAFLLSDRASHVNGAAWVVDGGATAC